MPILFGVTSAGKMVPIQVDDNGLVLSQGLGWIGAAWQKNPLVLGYSGAVVESLSNTSLAAGANTISGTAVPAGEIQVITQIRFRYAGTVAGVILAPTLLISGVESDLEDEQTIVSGKRYGRSGWWVLPPAGLVRLYVIGATLNDDAYLSYSGFRVDIDQ